MHLWHKAGVTPRFETLADLQAERCLLLIRCKGCNKYVDRTVHQLTGKPWGPDLPPGDLTETIASVVARLRCSNCGGNDVETWPQRTGAAMDDWRRARANRSHAERHRSEPDP